MTGGIIIPPVLAVASTAAANSFIAQFLHKWYGKTASGKTLATTLPDIVPTNELEKIATLAGPPRDLPASANEISIKICPPVKLLRMSQTG